MSAFSIIQKTHHGSPLYRSFCFPQFQLPMVNPSQEANDPPDVPSEGQKQPNAMS